MKIRQLTFLLGAALAASFASAAEPLVVPIWNGVPPGSEGQNSAEVVRLYEESEHIITNVHKPDVTAYLPAGAAAQTAAVLILPGGGHRELWSDHEGHNVARWLSERGVAGFVLKYRLSSQEGSPYTIAEHEVADAKRALRLIRNHATAWNVDPARLGIMGFSAGGETAARAAMQPDDGNAEAADPVERKGTRLAFQALIYPGNSKVIQPAPGAPPVFHCWGYHDSPEVAAALGELYGRFLQAGVLVEMHEYSDANHGFGLRARDHSPAGKWIERFHEWLDGRGLLTPASSESQSDGAATGEPPAAATATPGG